MSTDIIIPVYRPKKNFLYLLDCLQKQTIQPEKIIIINTEKKYFEQLLPEHEFLEAYPGIILHHISEQDFDHGGTRNLGVSFSQADYFLMMTQDAIPKDRYVIENLLKAMEEEKTAVAYARQCAPADSQELERFVRSFNYGSHPIRKTLQDTKRLGIKTYFCSNVCAIYRKEIFLLCGGFPSKVIFNEDMIYAAGAVQAGYAIQYVPGAVVFHAHNYTNKQQFCRNFDLGVSHAEHPEVFGGLSSESEGFRMLKRACLHLLQAGKPHLILRLFFQSAAKYLGYYAGKHYQKLSGRQILKYTMNPYYWKKGQ